jgi:hypothetical protein
MIIVTRIIIIQQIKYGENIMSKTENLMRKP